MCPGATLNIFWQDGARLSVAILPLRSAAACREAGLSREEAKALGREVGVTELWGPVEDLGDETYDPAAHCHEYQPCGLPYTGETKRRQCPLCIAYEHDYVGEQAGNSWYQRCKDCGDSESISW